MKIEKAIGIINKIRINNSFTMCKTFEEFNAEFVERYNRVFGTKLAPEDIIEIATALTELDTLCDDETKKQVGLE